MPNIFLIGSRVTGYADTLSSKGYKVQCFESTPKAIQKLNDANLIVIDKDHKESLKELTKAAKRIPKLIISSSTSSTKLSPWLKEPFSYPLHEPSKRELLSFIARILKEMQVYKEKENLKKTTSLLKKEIGFFEEINKMLTSSRDINEILAAVMKRVKAMTQAEAWSILILDENTGELIFEKTEGKVKKKVKNLKLKPGEGIAGWVAKEGIPVVVPDVSKDKRFSKKIDRYAHFDTKSIMCAPIISKDKIIGVLEVINKRTGESFTEEDLKLLTRLVDQAALAIEWLMLYQKMEELVITDDLTNLFNSRYLNRTIETEILRCNRYNTSLSVIFLDLDYFKEINDTYGHLVGSKALVEVGHLLINQLRSVDIVARYGGDEFVIVLPQTSPNNAVMIAERIRKNIEQNLFLQKEGYNIRMTASLGVASYPETAKSKEELLRLADEAMYNVKHRTRNGVYAII
jgi:diguanylate cyclase (GGDEF)-like protein